MATLAKKKCRQYSVEYLGYGFIPSPQDRTMPMCLVCMTTLSNESMRPCKLQKHLETSHKDKKDKPLEYFRALRDNFETRPTVKNMFAQKSAKAANFKEKGLIASYEISKLIAKEGKPHNIGESLILPAVSVVITTVMDQNAREVIESIPLSNNSVSRRIDEMAEDVENQLVSLLKVKKFAMQIDESCLPDNTAILMAYVRYLHDNELREEMLFTRQLRTDTKGETIFEEVKRYFSENDIPLENILACATDGAASMTGRYRGFITYLKGVVPELFCIHCVVHRQHLVAKALAGRLHESLQMVIQAVNYIKSNALQDRLFRQLCEDNNEDFTCLLLHTEVRWLSKGNCLRRFVTLWESVVAFFKDKEMGGKLTSAKCDIFYLSDVFEKLNLLNKQLQGRNCDLFSSKEIITGFLGKLKLYATNIGRREFAQFSSLAAVSDELKDDDIIVYVNHLKGICNDMGVRFRDLIDMDIPAWVADPFALNAVDVDVSLQEPLLELQSDIAAKLTFNQEKHHFWMNRRISEKFPQLWDKVKLFLMAFPTSYLVESGFSRVTYLLSQTRNRLNIMERGDLRLSLTAIEPEIKKIVSGHQAQGSH